MNTNHQSLLIQDKALSIDEAFSFILDEESGGNCLFVGTVRSKNKGANVTHLDFDSYDSMALKEMEKIANKCFQKFGIKKIAIHHRKGHVGIKDIAVIIAVSSGHRDGCFSACRFAIDSLKENVPIWKKEFLEDGNYWVGARP